MKFFDNLKSMLHGEPILVPNNWFFNLFKKYKNFNLTNILIVLCTVGLAGAIIYDLGYNKPTINRKLDEIKVTIDNIQSNLRKIQSQLPYDPEPIPVGEYDMDKEIENLTEETKEVAELFYNERIDSTYRDQQFEILNKQREELHKYVEENKRRDSIFRKE